MLPVTELSDGLALTFDDGPHPSNTPLILEALRAAGVTATFFMLGPRVVDHPDLVHQVLDAGALVGVHGWDHVDLRGRPALFVEHQLRSAIDALNCFGVTPSFFRPPFGWCDDGMVAVASKLGLQTVGWSIDPRDWDGVECDAIVADVERQLEPGAIVLLHDGGGDRNSTAEAVPGLAALARTRSLEVVDLRGEIL